MNSLTNVRQKDIPARAFLQAPLRNLSELHRKQFEQFGRGPTVLPDFTVLHHAFEHQVRRQPGAVAARHLEGEVTYGQLNRQANLLAAHLTKLGVKSGDNVGLFLQRSLPMLTGILAILKCGAAYVPQHVGVAPKTQLEHVIATANTQIVLTLSGLRDQIPLLPAHTCICLDEFLEASTLLPDPGDSNRAVSADQCAFIIFTSGTTGVPNGVQVTHLNTCNILLTDPGRMGIGPGVTVGQLLSIAFDMSVWEILGCLTNGGTLLIRGADISETAQQCEVIIATPSVLNGIDSQRCTRIKSVAVAGEPCPLPLAERWAEHCRFFNSCGPTESTIVNTMQRFAGAGHPLTIGQPTPNNTVYVLDEHLEPCAIGEVGEMWAGGDCVSTGYLGNDELNRQRYVPDPFLGEGRFMFRTRDLGRWTEDGELEHRGRVDDQVKVRGFRVELDSVSSLLESTPACERAVTLKLDHQTLVAFVCPADVNVEDARQRCQQGLPYYCVPALVVAMETLPVTSRGKIDKRLLLEQAERSRSEWEVYP